MNKHALCIDDPFILTCIIICSSNPRKENKATNSTTEKTIVDYLQKQSSER